LVLIGAHYDSVAGSPGADDNASAVAALLACAKTIGYYEKEAHVCFVAFNREEDGLMGSWDFVSNYHKWSDTPDTLDYAFLRRVTQLLLLQVLVFSRLKTTRANFYIENHENICLLV